MATKPLTARSASALLDSPDAPADRYAILGSPVGDLLVTGNGHQLTGLSFADNSAAPDDLIPDEHGFAHVADQLGAYFEGVEVAFDLPIAVSGNDFQRRVWTALTTIGYGETASYGQIARMIGRRDAARAVGAANHVNPIAIVIPCHRVIGADGSLVGFGGGLSTKRFLLDLEAQTLF